MQTVNPIHTGMALAATVAVGYTACALAFWAWLTLVQLSWNALFHGLDFRKLQSGPLCSAFGLFFRPGSSRGVGICLGRSLRMVSAVLWTRTESGLKPCRNAERRWFRRAECIICSPGIASFFQVFAR